MCILTLFSMPVEYREILLFIKLLNLVFYEPHVRIYNLIASIINIRLLFANYISKSNKPYLTLGSRRLLFEGTSAGARHRR